MWELVKNRRVDVDDRHAAEQTAGALNRIQWCVGAVDCTAVGRNPAGVRCGGGRGTGDVAHFDDFDVALTGTVERRAGLVIIAARVGEIDGCLRLQARQETAASQREQKREAALSQRCNRHRRFRPKEGGKK